MDAIGINRSRLIDWSVAGRALPGEVRSGDLHVVEPFPHGVLVGVVDGLGHGDDAADAAHAATDTLARYAAESPVALVRRCHEELRATRGAAMSVASFDGRNHAMSWVGVGNVEGWLFRGASGSGSVRESLLLRGGVVGYRLPALLPSVVSVNPGDLLVLATDGIDGRSFEGVPMIAPPQRIADAILARFARGADDALVLVARYRGEIS